MAQAPIRYQSNEEDSARWNDFPFRDGDIVISTRSKSGTTWMQMICALLVFQTPELPQPLGALSPWLDWKVRPLDDLVERLEAQQHRRFIKTHTPLDGIPLDDRATYIVVVRDPRDMYISLYHQGDNIDRAALRRLLGEPEPGQAEDKPSARPELAEALQAWVDNNATPQESMDSIRGVFHHVTDAWRRQDQTNVTLVHYNDLLAELEGQMRQLARKLGISVPAERWPGLVEAASFTAMQARATTLVPAAGGILKDVNRFFREGSSGGWRELMSDEQLRHYKERVAALAPPDVVAWVHRDAGFKVT